MASRKKEPTFPTAPKKTLEPNREPLHVGAPAEHQAGQQTAAPDKRKSAPTKKESQPRKATTVNLPLDYLEEAKGFVATTYGVPGSYKTFANFMERALIAEVERARQEYNDGQPLPRELHNLELRTGRPMGS